MTKTKKLVCEIIAMKYTLTKITGCLALLMTLGVSPASAEQKCKDSILETSPASNFTLHDNGTVSHYTTGLEWMRCSLGQEWVEGTCRGDVSGFTWSEALAAARRQVFAGYNDWRLPNINELESIVEERCVSQAINTAVFPATPPAFFWSSSPYAGLGSGAWSVDFNFGVVTASVKDGKMHVRLVRSIE